MLFTSDKSVDKLNFIKLIFHNCKFFPEKYCEILTRHFAVNCISKIGEKNSPNFDFAYTVPTTPPITVKKHVRKNNMCTYMKTQNQHFKKRRAKVVTVKI